MDTTRSKRPADGAIVLQAQLDLVEALLLRARRAPLLLLGGDRHSEDLTAVLLARVHREPAEPAPEIEHAHPGLEARLLADEVELGVLRLLEVLGVLPVTAGVHHATAQHDLVEIVADVVVRLGDLLGALAALHVGDERLEREQLHPQAALDLLLDVDPEELLDEEVERFALPPLLHVRLAEADRRVPQEPAVEGRVLHQDVSRPLAIDAYVGALEDLADDALGVRASVSNPSEHQ